MDNNSSSGVLVAANTPFNQSILTYFKNESKYERGDLVEVPLGNRKVKGIVLEINKDLLGFEGKNIKSILNVLDYGIRITNDELRLFEWMSYYYHYPLGPLIFDCLPKLLNRPRKLNFIKGEGKKFDFLLNKDQESIFKRIRVGLNSGFSKYLIHGVTGSGKSFLYLTLFKKVLEQGKSVLFILPEINLTTQFINLFSKFLEVQIFLYHSSISNSDKFGLWKKVQNLNEPILIIGVRSSVFLPVKNLGLMVIDEEHDSSFKQDDRCTYNARDVAIKKTFIKGIPIVLGSATPSVESYQYFQEKKDIYFTLKKRMGTSDLPVIELVDSRKNSGDEEVWPLSSKILGFINESLGKGEQVLVFINRLGFASYLMCKNCGHKFTCPNCTVSLKYFKFKSQLKCQICQYVDLVPCECPDCGSMKLLNKGFGTEKVQEVLRKNFPNKKIERFDRENLTTFERLDSCLEKFHSGQTDILVGTQMMSKGHNFKRVKLVVILGIDSQLNYPDFRSNEKAYQLLTQVSGRAGRFGEKGRVLIQTNEPENPLFEIAKNKDFSSFYKQEIQLRKDINFPPFAKMVLIYFSGKFRDRVEKACLEARGLLDILIFKHFKEVKVEGPRPSIIEKKANKITWILLVRGTHVNQLHNCLNSLSNNLKIHHSVSLKMDIDPQNIG